MAVIGHGLWKRRFNGDPRVIGTTLVVNRKLLTIIGVAPPEFHGSMPPSRWSSLAPRSFWPPWRWLPAICPNAGRRTSTRTMRCAASNESALSTQGRLLIFADVCRRLKFTKDSRIRNET